MSKQGKPVAMAVGQNDQPAADQLSTEMSFAPYDEYKLTGIEWLPQAPTHWQTKSLRYVCRLAYGDSLAAENREDGEIPVYGSNGQVGTHDTPNTLAPVIVVGRKGSFGKLNYSLEPVFAIDTTYFIDKRHCSENLDWLAYALQSLKLDDASKDSAVPGLAREDAYKHKLPVPPLDEQQTIARFLDLKTVQIDTLVVQKRRLIANLKEKRSALIACAVTRGLPPEAAKAVGLEPNPEMKNSGVEWLREIPAHWKITQLKYAASKIIDCPHDTPLYEPSGTYCVARTADLDSGTLDLSRAYRVDESEYLRRIRRAKVLPSDILYGREGERWGHAAIVPPEPAVCLGQRMMQFRANARFSPKFLMWHLNARCVYEQGALDAAGSTAPHVNVETIRNYQLVEPPLAEQVAIATFIDTQMRKIDTLTSQIHDAISRLTEYRQALINSAVTGKIDVREFA